jgi:hypothetical protein
MKKIAVNFEDITTEVVQAIAKQYPQVFIESDIVSFSGINDALEHSVKLLLNETVYIIKKSAIVDWSTNRYEEGYFKTFGNEEEQEDADL